MRVIHFGAYGWRARFDDGFDEASVARIASALGLHWGLGAEGSRVLIGYDTRHDGAHLATLAGEVIASFGLEVLVSSRPCITPALSCAVAADPKAVGAVMLTAGDMPCEYGGIVVRGADGGQVSEPFAREIDGLISSEVAAASGHVEYVDVRKVYADTLSRSLMTGFGALADPANHSLIEPLVVDVLHGAASGLMPKLLRYSGISAIEIHASQPSNFGNLHPKAVEPWVDECEATVTRHGASMGIVINGDGSRCALVDGRGTYVTPHELIPLVIDYLVTERGLSGRVVLTQTASVRAQRQAERLGLDCRVVPVGFSRLTDEIREGNVLLACDERGGIAVPSHMPERDGVFAALCVLDLICRRGKTLAELLEQQRRDIGGMAYSRKDIRLDAAIVQSLRNVLPGLNPANVAGAEPVAVSHADGLRLEFEDGAWLMIRPSRTEAAVRVYAEANSPRRTDELLEEGGRLVLQGRRAL